MDVYTRNERVRALHLREVLRSINPPIRLRSQCRFCGQPMDAESSSGLAMKANGDAYAHQGCVERER